MNIPTLLANIYTTPLCCLCAVGNHVVCCVHCQLLDPNIQRIVVNIVTGILGTYGESFDSDFAALKLVIADLGFTFIDVPHDGNCALHGICEQLRNDVNFSESSVTELRQKAVQFLRNHPDLLDEHFLVRSEHADRNAYLQKKSRSGEWCDEFMLRAISAAENIEIQILHQNRHWTILKPPSDTEQQPSTSTIPMKTVQLAQVTEKHYVSICMCDRLSRPNASSISTTADTKERDVAESTSSKNASLLVNAVDSNSPLGPTASRTSEKVITEVEPCSFPSTANQPNIEYKRDEHGRRFSYSWYKKWEWLDWDNSSSKVFCHPCRMVKLLQWDTFAKNAQPTFSSTGFNNWKDAMRLFQKHGESGSHKESLVKWTAFCTNTNVISQLDKQISDEQRIAQCSLLKIISAVQFLGRQGIAFRGHE